MIHFNYGSKGCEVLQVANTSNRGVSTPLVRNVQVDVLQPRAVFDGVNDSI